MSQNDRGFTPPKGRPTPRRGEREREQVAGSSRTWLLQWVVVGIILLIVIVGLVIVFPDSSGLGRGGGGHN